MTGLTLTDEMLRDLVDDKSAAGAVRLMAFVLDAADEGPVVDFPPFHLRDAFAVNTSDYQLARAGERVERALRRLERWGLVDTGTPTRVTIASGWAA